MLGLFGENENQTHYSVKQLMCFLKEIAVLKLD